MSFEHFHRFNAKQIAPNATLSISIPKHLCATRLHRSLIEYGKTILECEIIALEAAHYEIQYASFRFGTNTGEGKELGGGNYF